MKLFDGMVCGIKDALLFQVLFRVFSHIKGKIKKRRAWKAGAILKGAVSIDE